MINDNEIQQYDDSIPTYANVHNVFINLLGYITYILNFGSYQESFDDYNDMLSKIVKMAVNYERNQDLSLINFENVIKIYKLADNLQTKYTCNDNMGRESELSDYVLNWIQHLIVLIKNNNEEKENNNGK